jgi:hypothetical protein
LEGGFFAFFPSRKKIPQSSSLPNEVGGYLCGYEPYAFLRMGEMNQYAIATNTAPPPNQTCLMLQK